MALGIGISARAQTPGTALVVLVGLWFANSLVAPPLGASIASFRHPSPDTIAFAAAIEQEKAERPGWDARVAAAEERFLAGEAMPSAANPEVVALIESEADDTELYNRHFSRLFDIYERQSRAYQQLGVGAPMLAVQSLSMALAGTDYAHYRRFLDATSDYRTAFIDMLNRELAGLASWKSFSMMSGVELWSRLPEFEFDTAPVRWALAEQMWSLLALGAWLVASTAFAVWAVRSAPID
jgi:ABC-2 type transport system permease protein